jgi:hypothetical protein
MTTESKQSLVNSASAQESHHATTTDNSTKKKGGIQNMKTPFGEPVGDVFKSMFKKDAKPKDPWWRVWFFQV